MYILWGHVSCPKNIWPDRFSRFDVNWLPTDRRGSHEPPLCRRSLLDLRGRPSLRHAVKAYAVQSGVDTGGGAAGPFNPPEISE